MSTATSVLLSATTAIPALSTLSHTWASTSPQPTTILSDGASSNTGMSLALLPVNEEILNCRLVGPFSIAVQALVGTLGFSTLIIKRHFERPRRPWLVWSFDVSKQVIGGTMMHMSNLLVSALSGKANAEGENATNPCSWYVLNLTIDCTLGVLIVAGYLKLYEMFANRLRITGLESGHYGNPPNWRRWIKQAALFCISMISMKLTVILLITIFPFLVAIGDGILKPVQMLESPRFQIIFVMAIWPLILNIFESWVIDHVIKKKHGASARTASGHVPLSSDDQEEQMADETRFSTSFEMAATSTIGSRTLAGSSIMPSAQEARRSSIDMPEFELEVVSDGEDSHFDAKKSYLDTPYTAGPLLSPISADSNRQHPNNSIAAAESVLTRSAADEETKIKHQKPHDD
ncbi:hypothetical protein H4R99_003363 [Coemansia sp. RSA 1722]|nr:hypothetical protein IWW45_005564 [Coemansia sp. RSA 485]KAJ2600368.1 hypothetical protein H4R99_003363 [Coemansia sp. RSA 1722]KAJ2601894.1 hypothetical protein GGF39_000995 [Coemansia sp. RSA 1721]